MGCCKSPSSFRHMEKRPWDPPLSPFDLTGAKARGCFVAPPNVGVPQPPGEKATGKLYRVNLHHVSNPPLMFENLYEVAASKRNFWRKNARFCPGVPLHSQTENADDAVPPHSRKCSCPHLSRPCSPRKPYPYSVCLLHAWLHLEIAYRPV